jgi:oligopeptide/dipeptide ABC transporter ATP-binding protein
VSSLNPCFTVAYLLMETLKIHQGGSKTERRARALQLLRDVEIPDAPARLDAYPHQLSGGMSQRVMVAMAIACQPRVLIADEPTTALDVSIQAQVLNLLMDLQDETHVAYVFISHNLAVVELMADEVLVMYLGKVVERAPKAALFSAPRHPYTRALLASTPRINTYSRQQKQVPTGELASPLQPPSGCAFRQRCPHAQWRCRCWRPWCQASGWRVCARPSWPDSFFRRRINAAT